MSVENIAQPATTSSFNGCRKGSTSVEIALVALPFFLTLYAVFEIAYGNFAQARLDAAVRQASRLVMTGYVQNQTVGGAPLTADQFRDKVLCPRLPSLLKCADVFVSVTRFSAPKPGASSPYDAFVNATNSGLKTPALESGKNAYCVGDARDYVVMQAAYPLPMLTGVLQRGKTTVYNGRSARLLLATMAFKNEPFPAPAAGKPKGC